MLTNPLTFVQALVHSCLTVLYQLSRPVLLVDMFPFTNLINALPSFLRCND